MATGNTRLVENNVHTSGVQWNPHWVTIKSITTSSIMMFITAVTFMTAEPPSLA